mmetsp:Transcript_78098/g.181191  ORF Transcript_78098/g.181191 Transcript_78098/m.181191 type:complete len:96 (-) Transcript_78098:47-334(-)
MWSLGVVLLEVLYGVHVADSIRLLQDCWQLRGASKDRRLPLGAGAAGDGSSAACKPGSWPSHSASLAVLTVNVPGRWRAKQVMLALGHLHVKKVM